MVAFAPVSERPTITLRLDVPISLSAFLELHGHSPKVTGSGWSYLHDTILESGANLCCDSLPLVSPTEFLGTRSTKDAAHGEGSRIRLFLVNGPPPSLVQPAGPKKKASGIYNPGNLGASSRSWYSVVPKE